MAEQSLFLLLAAFGLPFAYQGWRIHEYGVMLVGAMLGIPVGILIGLVVAAGLSSGTEAGLVIWAAFTVLTVVASAYLALVAERVVIFLMGFVFGGGMLSTLGLLVTSEVAGILFPIGGIAGGYLAWKAYKLGILLFTAWLGATLVQLGFVFGVLGPETALRNPLPHTLAFLFVFLTGAGVQYYTIPALWEEEFTEAAATGAEDTPPVDTPRDGTSVTEPTRSGTPPTVGTSERLAGATLAGLVAGALLLLLSDLWAAASSFGNPLYFRPAIIAALYGLGRDATVGWAAHLVSSALSGLLFGALLSFAPLSSSTRPTLFRIGGGLVYGLALWALVWTLLGPLLLGFAQPPVGGGLFVSHVVYGLVLGGGLELFVRVRGSDTGAEPRNLAG